MFQIDAPDKAHEPCGHLLRAHEQCGHLLPLHWPSDAARLAPHTAVRFRHVGGDAVLRHARLRAANRMSSLKLN